MKKSSMLMFLMALLFFLLPIISFAGTGPDIVLPILSDDGKDVNCASNSFAYLKTVAHGYLITIIESQSYDNLHTMDQVWLNIVTALGSTGTIMPQSTLDNTDFFSTTDILIISSGLMNIPANRKANVLAFIQQGGTVYIQAEYLKTFDPDVFFASIVNSLGGSFTWGNMAIGELTPMLVLGNLAGTPNEVTSLDNFWYGTAGAGDSTIENFLEYQSQYFGFIFTPPDPNYGIVVTSSDQDWVITSAEHPAAVLLMKNIIALLSSKCKRNPYDLNDDSKVDIVDIMQVASRWNTQTGDPNYDVTYDVNGDGKIDIVDIMLVAAQWGWTA